MPYVPPELKERIKREISIQRLAEARGIKLRSSGKELIGLCPFHQDTHPSLNIDPVKNVWDCKGACGEGGDVIKWVMRAEGISFTHAVELLKRNYLPSPASAAEPPPKQSSVPKLPPLFETTADDQKLLGIVVDYYHRTLKQSPGAQQYLIKRGLQSAEMVEHFKLGFSNRSLNYHLQDKNRAEGLRQRARLEELGILREKSGHEHFVGSLVIPIFDLSGQVVQMYGRKINDRLRPGTEYHLYLPGPRCGVWNEQALIASKEIILCEALIDALTFWCAGYRNVTTSYGVNGFNDSHREAFQKHGTRRVYIAYDRDEAGEKAGTKHAEELMQRGIECFRVRFPPGQDANEFARKNQPAAKFLGMYLTSAAWLGKGQRPTVAVMTPASPASQKERKPEPMKNQDDPPTPSAAVPEEKPKSAAKEKIAGESPTSSTAGESIFPLAVPFESVPPEETEQRTMPLSAPAAPQIKIDNGEIVASFGARTYRVLNLEKCTSLGRMQVNVKVSGTNVRGECCYHGDTLDMESFARRAAFGKQTAHELAAKEETIQREVGQLWGALGDLQREWLRKTLTPEAEAEEETIMTAEEQAAALELLRDPRLLERVLEDFEKCGVVGEETNKKVSYLAAVSRLLEKPLAIVVQSASSAGKSSLMEAVLDFMPEEQRESYTAMTGQALFYMGQKNLKHKILAISEQQGADRASYPLKLLQSEGKLNIASTGKDPASGKLVTHDYEVEGPVMLFLTTTAQEVDEELLNRAIALTVNEDREQTRAIQQKQREARTIEGHLLRRKRVKLVRLHRNAQRLLRPITVVNNHDVGEFPDIMTRARRDHAKLLTLIDAIALLHQHQREIKTIATDDGPLEYIEASKADVQLARALAEQVGLRPSLDELRPQARKLLALISEMAKAECERLRIEIPAYRFTRRAVREFTRWGDTQLRQHLKRLEEMEYLVIRRGGNQGQMVVYQLATTGEETDRSPNFAGSESNFAGVNDDFAGASRALRSPGKSDESPVIMRGLPSISRLRGNAHRGTEDQGDPQNRIVVVAKPNGAEQPNGHGLAKHAAVK